MLTTVKVSRGMLTTVNVSRGMLTTIKVSRGILTTVSRGMLTLTCFLLSRCSSRRASWPSGFGLI